MSITVRPVRPLAPVARARSAAAPARAQAPAPTRAAAPARPAVRTVEQRESLGKQILGGVAGGALGLVGGAGLGWVASALAGQSAALGFGILLGVPAVCAVAGIVAGAYLLRD